MDKNFYVIGTVTYAVKGREILRRNGIKAHVERSFAADRIGCGYGIVAEADVKKVLMLLSKANITVKEVKSIE